MIDTLSYKRHMHPKPKVDELLTTQIKRTGSSGEGISDFHGFTLFVEGALVPEQVNVQITEVKKNFACAKLVSINTPSPFRVTPRCSLFETCGGCQTMHMQYDYQLQIKQKRVLDALVRIAKLENITVNTCLSSPSAYCYRNKIQMPIRAGKNGLIIGFCRQNTHDVVDVEFCHIHNTLGQKVYEHVRKILKESKLSGYDPKTGRGELCHLIIKSSVNTGQALVLLVTNGKGSLLLKDIAKAILQSTPEIQGVVQNCNKNPERFVVTNAYTTLAGKDHIEEKILGFRITISSASFFQINPAQAEHLYSKVLEFCTLQGHETVLDAYCGVGALSIILSRHAKEVIGVEAVYEAIVDARANCQKNGIENVRFVCQKTEDFIRQVDHIDVCILNPPRSGCEKSVLDTLGTSSCKKIIYVSCDPATLARDLAILTKYQYKVLQVQPLDMFPQTAHVETIVLLGTFDVRPQKNVF
jgi:23S rRNA (uracil1939-C5)-methyltransferase